MYSKRVWGNIDQKVTPPWKWVLQVGRELLAWQAGPGRRRRETTVGLLLEDSVSQCISKGGWGISLLSKHHWRGYISETELL